MGMIGRGFIGCQVDRTRCQGNANIPGLGKCRSLSSWCHPLFPFTSLSAGPR